MRDQDLRTMTRQTTTTAAIGMETDCWQTQGSLGIGALLTPHYHTDTTKQYRYRNQYSITLSVTH